MGYGFRMQLGPPDSLGDPTRRPLFERLIDDGAQVGRESWCTCPRGLKHV